MIAWIRRLLAPRPRLTLGLEPWQPRPAQRTLPSGDQEEVAAQRAMMIESRDAWQRAGSLADGVRERAGLPVPAGHPTPGMAEVAAECARQLAEKDAEITALHQQADDVTRALADSGIWRGWPNTNADRVRALTGARDDLQRQLELLEATRDATTLVLDRANLPACPSLVRRVELLLERESKTGAFKPARRKKPTTKRRRA